MHRDLKPENILLVSQDLDNFDVKITDFGFSSFFDPNEGLNTQIGTPFFMAPELI